MLKIIQFLNKELAEAVGVGSVANIIGCGVLHTLREMRNQMHSGNRKPEK